MITLFSIEREEYISERKEIEENYKRMERMTEKKDDQLEEMRVEIERLAGKLCAAESKLYEVMG